MVIMRLITTVSIAVWLMLTAIYMFPNADRVAYAILNFCAFNIAFGIGRMMYPETTK